MNQSIEGYQLNLLNSKINILKKICQDHHLEFNKIVKEHYPEYNTGHNKSKKIIRKGIMVKSKHTKKKIVRKGIIPNSKSNDSNIKKIVKKGKIKHSHQNPKKIIVRKGLIQ